jgi:hypothetical protein
MSQTPGGHDQLHVGPRISPRGTPRRAGVSVPVPHESVSYGGHIHDHVVLPAAGSPNDRLPAQQGLNAAILDGPPPPNILQEIPEPTSQFDYSPLRGVHLEAWTAQAVAAGVNLRQTDFSAAMQQVTDGNATGFPDPAFGPSGIVVNCPVVSLDVTVSG